MPLTKVSSRAIEDTLRYVLGSVGSVAYTFTGPGLSGAVNDPTLTLSRGHTYIFENRNSNGAHPFYIKTSLANGGTNDAYNTGVTNNGGAGGTEIVFTVPHDAPDLLYYQCSSHSSMNGQLKIAGAVADGSITESKLANNAVTSAKIADDAVTSAKIADNPSFSGTSGIKLPVGTTAQRVNTEALLRYNSELDLPEYYNGTDYVVIDSPPNITSVSPTEVESAAGGNITFTINGSRFSVGATVKFISNTGTEITASTVTRVSSSQLTAVAAKSSFVNAQEPYDVKVTNSSGLSAVLEDQINVDNAPAWVTSSGSLGSFGSYNTFSVTVSATDPEGDTISYSIVSGSLPSGVTLNSSSGVISGSVGVSSPTTYSFTLRATAGGKTADRAFSFTVNLAARAYNYTGSTQQWTRPDGLTAVTAIVWGAGGGGGGDSSGDGGGSGGYSQAVIDVSSIGTLYLIVGQGGDGGQAYSSSHINWMEGGGGGGLSGIFDNASIGHGDSILIAGSGGGGGGADSNIGANGGAGGGANQSGTDGDDDARGPGGNSGGDGGSTSSGGAAGSNSSAGSYQAVAPTAGSQLEGGINAKQAGGGVTSNLRGQAYYQGGNVWSGNGSGLYASGSGGAGYYGGGGGNTGYAGGGGGGSGYAKSSVTSSVSGTVGNKGNSDNGGAAPQSGSSYYSAGIAKGGDKNANGGNGMIILIY